MPDLTPGAFERLLAFLDPNPDRAGELYEDLRRRLVFLFEGRSAGRDSETLADRTLDVTANKLMQGLELASYVDLSRYTLGVARNVLKDHVKQQRTAPLTVDPPAPAGDAGDAEDRLRCLERCLRILAPESRKLIVDFYTGERRVKIDNRAQMAEDLGITPNALRRRTHMIRTRLESCIRECVEGH